MRQSVNHTTLTKHYFSGTQGAVALAPLPLERGWGEVITAERTQPVGLYFLHGDHLGTATFVTNSSGEANQFFLNLPYGETMAEQTQREGYVNPYKFNAKELDSQTGLYYYGARYYNPRVSVWYSVDPLGEKTMDAYGYCYNNPVRYIDPDGMETKSTHLDDKGKVIAVYNDGDKGVYQHGKNADGSSVTAYQIGKRYSRYGTSANGKKLGESLTTHSFMDSQNRGVIGAVVNLGDNSGQSFIDNEIVAGNLSLVEYMPYATGNKKYDFKARGMSVNRTLGMSIAQYHYRGMYLNGKIVSARDVGNFAAGYVAADNGLNWLDARQGFDALESYQQGQIATEAPTTQLAQFQGFLRGAMQRHNRQEQRRNDFYNSQPYDSPKF